MAACSYKSVCGFYLKRVPVSDGLHTANVQKYCAGQCSSCAIYSVISKSSFLKVPRDLKPSQTFRVHEILAA